MHVKFIGTKDQLREWFIEYVKENQMIENKVTARQQSDLDFCKSIGMKDYETTFFMNHISDYQDATAYLFEGQRPIAIGARFLTSIMWYPNRISSIGYSHLFEDHKV